MWYLLQTLEHVSTATPVIYLGIDCKKLDIVTRNSNGDIIRGQANEFKEYRNQDGTINPGKHAIHEFFGICKKKHWKDYTPDLSVTEKGP